MTYLDDLGTRIRSALPQRVEAPPASDGLFRLYAVLARAKGATVSSSDVHDAWAAWIQVQDPSHPSLVPYDELDSDTQAEDDEYVDAIRRVSADLDS